MMSISLYSDRPSSDRMLSSSRCAIDLKNLAPPVVQGELMHLLQNMS